MCFFVYLVVVVVLIVVFFVDVFWWLFVGVGFVMVWLMNLYNFMDGVDGFVGGMVLFGFSGYVVVVLGGV